MADPVLSVRQPWTDLILAGAKPVENRTWAPPSTLPQWRRCPECGDRYDTGGDGVVCIHDQPVRCVLDGPYPFRLWLHASAEAAEAAGPETWPVYPVDWNANPLPEVYAMGAILGHVTVMGAHHADECVDFDSVTLGACVDIDGGWWHKPTDDRRCHTARYCSPWAEPDRWHWQLADPVPLDTPVPAKGRLGLWPLPEGIAADG